VQVLPPQHAWPAPPQVPQLPLVHVPPMPPGQVEPAPVHTPPTQQPPELQTLEAQQDSPGPPQLAHTPLLHTSPVPHAPPAQHACPAPPHSSQRPLTQLPTAQVVPQQTAPAWPQPLMSLPPPTPLSPADRFVWVQAATSAASAKRRAIRIRFSSSQGTGASAHRSDYERSQRRDTRGEEVDMRALAVLSLSVLSGCDLIHSGNPVA
jgi:hypothetical protein